MRCIPNMASEKDLDQIWTWNETVPVASERCVHDIVSEVCRKQPSAIAVSAWDGDWSYQQLDLYSSRLAHSIQRTGILLEPNDVVALCFEKSKWVPIIALAVMKSGAASILLDCKVPPPFLQKITQKASPVLLISSTKHSQLAERLAAGRPTIQLKSDLIAGLENSDFDHKNLPLVHCRDALYVVSTSGTTGMPKAVVISHTNFSSAIHHQQQMHNFTSRSRIYDFSSYGFDASWSNCLHAFTSGACLCIPSDFERENDLSGSILKYSTTIVDLTPSVARLLSVEAICSLETLIVAGEAVLEADVLRWQAQVKLINVYGPCECTPTATIVALDQTQRFEGAIGPGYGVNCWVVQPDDTDVLVPVGGTGELLLEGPLLGQGYLGEPELTNSSFIKGPSWLSDGHNGCVGRQTRLYKTGDLVRQKADGSLDFIGRKDTQIKLNGIRTELGEIEHHIRHAAPESTGVVVQAAKHQDGDKAILTAFVELDTITIPGLETLLAPAHARLMHPSLVSKLRTELNESLPRHMVPTRFVMFRAFPLTPSGKIDRKRMLEQFKAITKHEFVDPMSRGELSQQHWSDTERSLRNIWSGILGVAKSRISKTDNFFELGGDSLMAMAVIKAAQDVGLYLDITMIFTFPVLENLASESTANTQRTRKSETERPTDNVLDDNRVKEQVASICATRPEIITAVYPCTPLQEGLLALTGQDPEAYINRVALRLGPEVDSELVQRSWNEVVAATPILQTRIVQLPKYGLLQAVIREEIQWHFASNLEDYFQDDKLRYMGLGTPLLHAGLVTVSDSCIYFVYTMHHALYDGWSIGLIYERLTRALRGNSLALPPPFQLFVENTVSATKVAAPAFWAGRMKGFAGEVFPPLPGPNHRAAAKQCLRQTVEDLGWRNQQFTPTTYIRAGWALTVSRYTCEDDVVFGVITNGRSATVEGIREIIGPTIATIPFRVNTYKGTSSIQQLLQCIQDDGTAMIRHEQFGLQRIRRVNKDTEKACQFQTLLVVETSSGLPEEMFEPSLLQTLDGDEVAEEGETQAFDTYGLCLTCTVTGSTVHLSLEFDEAMLDLDQARRMLEQLEHALRQLCDQERKRLHIRDLPVLSDADKKLLVAWNSQVLGTSTICAHDLVTKTACLYPDQTAVSAWDGEWTYSEIDQLSTGLARYLMRCGVVYKSKVALMLEKSKWTPIAQLAVMKAGAASLSLDIGAEQSARTSAILSKVQPTALLTFAANQLPALDLPPSCQHIPLSAAQILNPVQTPDIELPTVGAEDTLYIIFTSGSTGTPKGVVVTHANFTSAIKYQQAAHGFRPLCRVLDFAAYAFDVAWSNLLHTFTVGGCLCIPSETERRERLEECFARYNISHADLTPSVARLLPLSTIATLDTLVLGGEELRPEDAARWAPLTTLINPYGPSECTPTATIACFDQQIETDHQVHIGKGYGVNTWIVNPDDTACLMPIGSVGELLLQGPIVGAGYLNDEELTNKAWIPAPSWLTEICAHPTAAAAGRSRIYRTGDLVRYDPTNGNVLFVGRKDSQAKIHGQRVDLGEIENALSKQPSVEQVVCVLVDQGLLRGKLVAIVTLEDVFDHRQASFQLLDERHYEIARCRLRAMQETARNTLPLHMVPSYWIPLYTFPTNTSGKTDRKALATWIRGLDKASSTKILALMRDHNVRKPVGAREDLLREACGQILNVSSDEIDLEASFMANGGDSITAMQLVSHCRNVNISIKAPDIMKCERLSDLSFAEPSSKSQYHLTVQATSFDTWYELSPIQRWYFELLPPGSVDLAEHHYHQGFQVTLGRSISNESVSAATKHIVKQHEMLRARFQHVQGQWKQKILSPDESKAYEFKICKASSEDDLRKLNRDQHQTLSPINGPVFSVVLVLMPEQKSHILFHAHHLVIDLVSWRIILADLEGLLMGCHSSPPPLSFLAWNQLQIEKSFTSELHPSRVLPPEQHTANYLSFWKFDEASMPNREADHEHLETHLNDKTTAWLFNDANAALNTVPVEIMFSAIWHAFFRTFPERQDLTIFKEAHGRETWRADMDLSRTVGWFTTMSPLSVSRDSTGNVTALVRTVKDRYRQLAAGGWAYWASRHLNPDGIEQFGVHGPVHEVEVNYNGRFQQLEREDGLFQPLDLPLGAETGEKLPAGALFRIEIKVEGGTATFEFGWNRHLAYQDRIRDWAANIASSMAQICSELVEIEKPCLSLCDFPYLGMNYGSLDRLCSNLLPALEHANDAEIEDVLPCSPLVDGILIHQLRSPATYMTSDTYLISPAQSAPKPVSLKRLAEAWQQVIVAQPSLRSVFINSVDISCAFNQVVLKSCNADIIVRSAESRALADRTLASMPELVSNGCTPPHRLTLCRVKDSPDVLCRIDMSHAITDGGSSGILLDHWSSTYNRLDDPKHDIAKTCPNFASHLIRVRDSEAKTSYWQDKLQGLQPCLFPQLESLQPHDVQRYNTEFEADHASAVHDFCTRHGTTAAGLFQTAWACVLSSYTKSHDVCFGYLASGRDLDIPGLQDAVGAYTNMLVCRVDTSGARDAVFVRSVHQQMLKDLDFQHVSLAEVQHLTSAGPGRPLFNSIVSFQHAANVSQIVDHRSADFEAPVEHGALAFKLLTVKDPSEFDLCVGISYSRTHVGVCLEYRSDCISEDAARKVIVDLEDTVVAIMGAVRK
ncbi:Nonribosomal peptide synthetase dtxS1 [Fulvia fulva]|uniref:Nonribosomal peptide synthetase dtxS1 n=1 Tax=Passalora fulva TaxID=5499 RepID=A0A9Q8UR16_PASFU|nr:Nonribosomal peptide synthetase dtxS1 [Fulvia fulva]KAK4623504.1 Nonribosomal peptide synthetase dtxS1 [Fulvia fulva]UJO19240.1 Nonribosomal peptide synthetase dtxS1 [Fulvia fulva]WPV30840.1 Nonribosomal peptide synthetase dtxS1 [Fulvia fulva]